MATDNMHSNNLVVINDDGYEDEVSSIPHQTELNISNNKKIFSNDSLETNNTITRIDSTGACANLSHCSSISEEISNFENPIQNRIIGEISTENVNTTIDERAKKMERRRSLQSKIKKPFRDSVNFDELLNSPNLSAFQPQILPNIPKLNLGHIEKFDDDVSSCGLSDCSDTELYSLDKKTILSNISTETSSTVNTPKRTKSTASIIAKAKRPHTARESRKELQDIVSNNCSILTENGMTETIDKKKQIAKLLTSSRSNSSLISPTSSNVEQQPRTPNSAQQMKRHSVAREFNSLQDYLSTRFKEQKQLMGPNYSPNSQKEMNNATPRSSALENKLLNMASSLKKTSQVLELNEVKLREERRKSAQVWALLSMEEDNHSMFQMKYEELKFHYDVKCEELKSAKKNIDQLTNQVKKLEGNYNFLDQEKIRLQREVQELKRTIEHKAQARRKRCSIM